MCSSLLSLRVRARAHSVYQLRAFCVLIGLDTRTVNCVQDTLNIVAIHYTPLFQFSNEKDGTRERDENRKICIRSAQV